MPAQKSDRVYSCGHPKPHGPIDTIIAHTKPFLHPHSQPELQRQQTQPLPHHMPADRAASPPPQTSSHAVIFSNPFNSPSNTPVSSLNASRRGSQTRDTMTATHDLEHELTAEERVAAGMEYMLAFLASRSRSSSASSSRSSSTIRASDGQTSRRAAMV